MDHNFIPYSECIDYLYRLQKEEMSELCSKTGMSAF